MSFAIPPDAVRVWRGYSAMALADFLTRLGTVFVPATVELQVQAGLDCYLPSVPAGMNGKPATVPDETAILFWDSQQTYTSGFGTLAVRTYTLTHAAVYAAGSGAGFPLAFAGSLVAEQPYFLVNQPADWMHGPVSHALAARPDAMTPADFLAACASVMGAVSSSLDGGVVCAGNDYVVFWGLGAAAAAAAGKLAGVLSSWNAVLTPATTTLPAGLWDQWPGMTIASGASFNMQFKRRWET